MADRGHDITMPARLGSQNAESRCPRLWLLVGAGLWRLMWGDATGRACLDRRPFLFAYGDGGRPGDSRGDDLFRLVTTVTQCPRRGLELSAVDDERRYPKTYCCTARDGQ